MNGVKSLMGRRPSRQISIERDDEADAQDILNTFTKIDSSETFPVKFVHWNIENVPKYGPEETEDNVTVSRISQHDQRLQAVENRADAQTETLRTLQVLVQELINKN